MCKLCAWILANMNYKTHLFNLIKSMQASEKGYFKKYASRYDQKGESDYIRLLNAMDELDEYDEKKIKEKLKKEAFVKHLSVTKAYLFDIILEALSSYQ